MPEGRPDIVGAVAGCLVTLMLLAIFGGFLYVVFTVAARLD